MSVPVLFMPPEPQTIAVPSIPSAEAFGGDVVRATMFPATAHSSASLTLDVPPAVPVMPTMRGRRLATSADYEKVSVPGGVALAVFDILLVAGEDVRTAAIWAVATGTMAGLAMRQRVFAQFIAWLADLLTPPEK
jgi:hypothetical protein